MQSTATVQTATRVQKSAKQETSAATKKNSDQTEFTDPFLKVIMSILAQTQDLSTQLDGGQTGTGAQNAQSGLSELAALLGDSSDGLTALLSTMLGECSDLNAAAAQDLSGASDTAGIADEALMALAALGALAANQKSGEAGTSALWQDYTVQTGQSPGLTELMGLAAATADTAATAETSAVNLNLPAQTADLSELLAQEAEPSVKDVLQPLAKNVGMEVLTDEAVSGQSDFSEAVVKAKQMLSEYMSQQSGNQDQDDADTDKLMNELTGIKTSSPFEIRLKAASDTGETNVLDQITDGIRQNLSLGKSEFTIRLKPENLGEITVKLVEEAGKTTLTITTASAHTAKIINSDIDALKEAVAPMNVEVHNAVTQTNESAGGSMQQFNMSGQQFAGQQFAGQQFEGRQSFYQNEQTPASAESRAQDESYAASQAIQAGILSGERLNTYV